MTPTESASLGAFLSIVLAMIFRQMTYKALKESMLLAVNVSAMMAFVLFTARMLGQVFQYIGLTEATAAFMLSLNVGKYTMLALICILYLILGCFFDSISMLVLTIPFVAPIIKNLGFDFIWFGVLYVVLAEIGLVTPPFGLNLFVLKGVVPKYEITYIFAGTIPFLIPTCILIVLMILFPDLVLWLPNLLYSR
jgi:TRAP-type C4-dicarboxylate transport system permease large subunit